MLATVGSGKTTTLVERVAHAVTSGFEPSRILTLTFTNRAAAEIRERLVERFGPLASTLRLRTFHGLCAEILRREARWLGLPVGFVVLDEQDSIDLMAQAADDVGSSYANVRNARDLSGRFGLAKESAGLDALEWPPRLDAVIGAFSSHEREIVRGYSERLRARGAIDFGDLVLFVRTAFHLEVSTAERWAGAVDLVQVDEVQDTHLSEYEVVRQLALSTGNLALFGDVDQSIYEWRGARPRAIIRAFERDFPNHKRLELTRNLRATRQLLVAAHSFAESMSERMTRLDPVATQEGDPIVWHEAEDSGDEARWVTERIRELGADAGTIGVLTPANWQAQEISGALSAAGVPHATVEEFDFFRRREVKAALAPLRLIVNPADAAAADRFCTELVEGVGDRTLARIRIAGDPCGLVLSDVLRAETHDYGDPLGGLLAAFREGVMTVIDTETTGLEPAQADVIEIAARRLERGVLVAKRHALLRTERPLSDFTTRSGLTQTILAAEGRDPADVLSRFLDFCVGTLIVGHNIDFDLGVLTAQSTRLGISVPVLSSSDTLDLARRFRPAPGDHPATYSLEDLVRVYGLRAVPTHRAPADADATVELLLALLEQAERGEAARRAIVAEYAGAFESHARRLASWRSACGSARPAEVLKAVVTDSGLERLLHAEPWRRKNIDRLIDLFERRDDSAVSPMESLRALTRYAAFARGPDFLVSDKDAVTVLTIFSAKGLEFDTVFLAGISNGDLPNYRADQDGRLDEYRRVFYVGLTRARRRLAISGVRERLGRPKGISHFVRDIDASVLRAWEPTTVAGI